VILLIGLALQATSVPWESDPVVTNQWTYVGSDDQGSNYYIRSHDLTNHSDMAPEIWIRADFRANRHVRFRYSVALYRFDCSRHMIATIAETMYMADGRHLDANIYPGSQPIVPDSAAEMWEARACPLAP
jgi:hypothetical protein